MFLDMPKLFVNHPNDDDDDVYRPPLLESKRNQKEKGMSNPN